MATRLNPCFCGSRSLRTLADDYYAGKADVLILVFVEVGL